MSDYADLVKRLRWLATDWDEKTQLVDGEPVRHWLTAGEARKSAAAIETLEKEIQDARLVYSDTFDSALRWRERSEAAEAEIIRLKAIIEENHP